MTITFSVELFDKTIHSSIDIPDYDLESISEKDKYDCILEFISNEINHTMQIYVDSDIDY